jgi:hypothetical protein
MADPVLIFFERIDVNGFLFAQGDLLLGDFLDAIGDAARQLVAALTADSTFAQACREADAEAGKRDKCPDLKPHRVPQATLDCAEWLARYGDAARFRAWLDRRDPTEALAIVRHIKKKRGMSCPE